MATEPSINSLFKEHSLDEIENIRDNLAAEIEKRTELLKSIVKEKYSDIVETSGAIQSMKLNLKEVEQSLWSFDRCISDFYRDLREPKFKAPHVTGAENEKSKDNNTPHDIAEKIGKIDTLRKVTYLSSEIWDHFDHGDLKNSLRVLKESTGLLDDVMKNNSSLTKNKTISGLMITFERAEEIIKNSLWHRIYSAAPDQIGIIIDSDEFDLYEMSLNSSMKFLVDSLREELSDLSYHAQIKRYRPSSFFNTKTSLIEQDLDIPKAMSVNYVQIPKSISYELSIFLYQVCKVINTIAGFNMSRSSIVESVRITIEQILQVYTSIVPLVDSLKAETKRKRALQLYFDLLYVRILLNTSKNIDLIEKLDPTIKDLTAKFEVMLDTVALYMISSALHTNVMILSQTTLRLNGLLIPHLQ